MIISCPIDSKCSQRHETTVAVGWIGVRDVWLTDFSIHERNYRKRQTRFWVNCRSLPGYIQTSPN